MSVLADRLNSAKAAFNELDADLETYLQESEDATFLDAEYNLLHAIGIVMENLSAMIVEITE